MWYWYSFLLIASTDIFHYIQLKQRYHKRVGSPKHLPSHFSEYWWWFWIIESMISPAAEIIYVDLCWIADCKRIIMMIHWIQSTFNFVINFVCHLNVLKSIPPYLWIMYLLRCNWNFILIPFLSDYGLHNTFHSMVQRDWNVFDKINLVPWHGELN